MHCTHLKGQSDASSDQTGNGTENVPQCGAESHKILICISLVDQGRQPKGQDRNQFPKPLPPAPKCTLSWAPTEVCGGTSWAARYCARHSASKKQRSNVGAATQQHKKKSEWVSALTVSACLYCGAAWWTKTCAIFFSNLKYDQELPFSFVKTVDPRMAYEIPHTKHVSLAFKQYVPKTLPDQPAKDTRGLHNEWRSQSLDTSATTWHVWLRALC